MEFNISNAKEINTDKSTYLIYAKPFYEATGYKYEGKQEVNK